MNPQISIQHNIGNIITVPNQLNIRARTYTTNNFNIGATAVPVDNAIDFTTGSTILLLLSSMGAENAEIVSSASHTDQSFTTSATKLNHSRGEQVSQINYDQIVILKSATIDGIYSTYATVNIQVTQQKTIVNDASGLVTDYYKVQWKNSLTNAVSDLSNPINVATYPENSVASVIFPVLKAMGISQDDPKITTEFCLGAIDDARKYVQGKLYGIRHAWTQNFNHQIRLLAGTNFVYLPDDIDFNETDRSVLAARFLIANILTPFNLRYIDKRNWNQIAYQTLGSEVKTNAIIGDITLELESTGDFPLSGVAYVATTDVDQVIMQIQYTLNDRVNNTLLGVTGITRNIPAGTQVWSQPIITQPIYYTVYENKLVFERIIPDSMQGNNVYVDYYKKTDDVTALYQVLPEHYREIYKWYLRYAVKYRKDINLASDDPDLKKFEDLVQALFNNLYTGQDTTIITS